MTQNNVTDFSDKVKELRELFEYIEVPPLGRNRGNPNRRIAQLKKGVWLKPGTWQFNAIFGDDRGGWDEREVCRILDFIISHLENATTLIDPTVEDLEEARFIIDEQYHDEYWPELEDWLINAGHSIEFCDEGLISGADLGRECPRGLIEVIQEGQHEYNMQIFNDVLRAIDEEFNLKLEI